MPEPDLPPSFIPELDRDLADPLRLSEQIAERTVGPLDEGDPVRPQVLVEQIRNFGIGQVEPVEVEVGKRQASPIGATDREGR